MCLSVLFFWVLCASCPVCWSKHLWTNLHFSQGSMLLNPGFGMHSTYIILMLSVASHFVISLWIKSSDPFSAPICAFPCFLDFLGCVFVHFKERYHSKTWLSLRYTSARHFVVEFGVVFDNFLALHSIFTTYPLFCMLLRPSCIYRCLGIHFSEYFTKCITKHEH